MLLHFVHPHLLDVKGCHPERCKKRIYDTFLVHIVFTRNVHAFSMAVAMHLISQDKRKSLWQRLLGDQSASQCDLRLTRVNDSPETWKFPVVSDSHSCYPSNAFIANRESMKGSLKKPGSII